ncbi:MAG: SAM-dependent methyltransferase [Methanobrevibacter sp.]|jgi:methylase of polypeptide subunit release factors|nr:SAM-dependent methyltransferase [Methanobrevibacter sp.]
MTLKTKQKEFGDYQTPVYFTNLVCNYLKKELNISPNNIIEPTCGKGNFLVSCLNYFPNSKIYGIEINECYLNEIREKINSKNLFLYHENIFNFNFNVITGETYRKNETLIIGNPPWINNTNLSILNSENIPKKSNFKQKRGIDSITGSSNFDIAEYIILKVINYFKNTNTTISFLCKFSVAREVFQELKRSRINFNLARIISFDAKKVFNISAEACIFIILLTSENISKDDCEVYDLDNTNNLKYRFGFKNNKFYSNLDNEFDTIDGKSFFEWHQGIKHDCSKIMELKKGELKKGKNYYINKKKEELYIEDTLICPLIKSSDIKEYILNKTNKYVIVTQKKVKEDTNYIEKLAPKTWSYLKENEEMFNNRKSIIYKNSPKFAMFGVGEYTFSKYKVGISGFYKNPIFSLLVFEKAVMMDDTCYFISFENYDDAYITMLILNSDLVQGFLKNTAFLDSKRPYTKKILQRIDFNKCVNLLEINDLIDIEKRLNLPKFVNKNQYNNFKKLLKHDFQKTLF